MKQKTFSEKLWEMWDRNFYNAKRFFDNPTNSKKEKWMKNYSKDIKKLFTHANNKLFK